MSKVIDGQLDLFEELEQIEEEEHLTCPCCGRTEGNEFLLGLNHGVRYDADGQRINPHVTVCVAMELTRNHAVYSLRRLDPIEREDYPKCFKHPSARKPCPQDHFDAEYEFYADRATRVWGGDDWKPDPTPPEVDATLTPDGKWICPHCGHSWSTPDMASGGAEALAAWHLTGWSGGEIQRPITQGRCGTQDLALEFLHTRRDAKESKGIKWGPNDDLLALILDCLNYGCTQDEIRDALAVEWRTS